MSRKFKFLHGHRSPETYDLIQKYEKAEYKPGGSIEENLAAGVKSWKLIVDFLKLNL
jgi:hypothetical protein